MTARIKQLAITTENIASDKRATIDQLNDKWVRKSKENESLPIGEQREPFERRYPSRSSSFISPIAQFSLMA